MKTTLLGALVATFLAALPFFVSRTLFYGAINAKFFFVVFVVDLLLLGVGYHLWQKKDQITLRGKWLLGALALTIAVQYLTSFTGVYPERSLFSDIIRSTGALFLTHIAALAVLLGSYLTEKDWSLVRKTVALSTALVALFVLIGNEGFGASGRFLWMNFDINGFSFGNSTFAGTYFLLALALALIEFFRAESKKWRYWMLAASVLILASPILLNIGILWGKTPFVDVLANPSLILGSARASSAAALALILFVLGALGIHRFVPQKGRAGTTIGWAALWLIGIVGGLALLFTPGSAVQEAYIRTSSEARIIVWSAGMRAIAERPLLGWGPENFGYAFESHFDNRVYLKENYGETWFERAHNVFVDTLSDSGALGIASFVLLTLAFWFAVYRARKSGVIALPETLLLAALPVAHLLQLQTGFDTVASYVLLGVVGGYALYLERMSGGAPVTLPSWAGKALALIVVVLALVSFKFVFLDELSRQEALFATFTKQNPEEQLVATKKSLERESNFELLRLSSASFLSGVLTQLAEGEDPKKLIPIIKPFIAEYEGAYVRYLEESPDYYRARMNYAYFLLTQVIFGEDRIEEAKTIIVDSYDLSPGNPLTYVLHALAEFYGGDAAAARVKVNEALALNPDIRLSQEVLSYIERQESKLPRVTIMRLQNL